MVTLARIETRRVDERRLVPRVLVDLNVRLRLPKLDVAYLGRSINISIRGMYVLVDGLTPVGTSLDVDLCAIGALVPMQLRGRVIRHGSGDEPSGMGLMFDWISPEAVVFIERLVSRS